MKVKLSVILVFTALIICTSVVQTSAATISFNILDSYIETAESFEVEVYAQEDFLAGDLTAFGFDVDTLSLSLFSYNGYTIGPDFLDLDFEYSGFGSYVAGVKENLTENAGINVLLATLSFTAGSTVGIDNLSISGISETPFFDRGLYYENFEYDQDIIGSTQIQIVPEPSSMLLLGAGIICLAGIGRKKMIR